MRVREGADLTTVTKIVTKVGAKQAKSRETTKTEIVDILRLAKGI